MGQHSPRGGERRRGSFGTPFRRLLAATALSSFGDGLVLVAFPLIALHFTSSPLLIAGVAATSRMPALVLGIPAGTFADRLPRRRLAVIVEWTRLAIVGAFAVSLAVGAATLVTIYLAVLGLGCCEQLFVAATFASVPALVDEADLDRANGRLFVADMTVEEVAGQGLGGVLVSLARFVPFAADALSFGASALLLRRTLPEMIPIRSGRSLWADGKAGLRWFTSQPTLRPFATLIASYAFCQYVVMAVLVLYVRRDLHQSAAAYGVLLAVAAIGTVAGSLGAARVVPRLGAVRTVCLAGLAAGLAYVALAAGRSVVVAGVALAVECAAVNLGNVASRSLRQRLIPVEMMGRVAMTWRTVINLGIPVGALVGGALGGLVGLPTTFAMAGTAQLVFVALLGPRLRDRRRPEHGKRRAAQASQQIFQ